MRISERAWLEIDLKKVKDNFNSAKSLCNNKICCVVKANAYGNGSKYLSRYYESLGADCFAVSNIYEGIELRKNGIKKPIINLGKVIIEKAELLYKFKIVSAVYSFDIARKLNDICAKLGITVNVHLKIDTGMERLGIRHDDVKLLNVAELMNDRISCTGVFSHLSCADCDSDFTYKQIERFENAVSVLEKKGLKNLNRHLFNSAGLTGYKDVFDMARAGIMLYAKPQNEICSLKCKVTQVKFVKKGERIGYGGEYVATKDMKIAVLPVGYADGVLRRYQSALTPYYHGKPCSVLGRICMDQMMICANEDIKEDETVTVFGYGGQSVNDLAKKTGTISYEIMTSVSDRVPRIYVNDQKVCAIDYGRYSDIVTKAKEK